MSVNSWSPSSLRESRKRPRVPRPFWVLIGIALALGASLELRPALQSPGQTIRGELEAAAIDLQSAPMEHSERALTQLRQNFRERDVTIDATLWPLVSVTLHGVDAGTCRDAVEKARRIEGFVVVALERYGAVDECGNTNDMTWRILP